MSAVITSPVVRWIWLTRSESIWRDSTPHCILILPPLERNFLTKVLMIGRIPASGRENPSRKMPLKMITKDWKSMSCSSAQP